MTNKHRPTIAQLDAQEFDMWHAVGGLRGLAESVVPGIVFVTIFIVSRDLKPAIIGSAALAAVAIIVRLATKTALTQAVSGLGGIFIGAIWAWRTGQAQDFYLWGLIVNSVFAFGTLVSIALKRPIVGLVVRAFIPDLVSTPAMHRIFRTASWLWAAAFIARLAVQTPLYFYAHVGWLGTARVVMGLPLWALVMWITWLLVRPVIEQASKDRETLEH
ncbi:MAG TPA: DUF3159 domain-containing protein [Beutenbergiaceae bacterium]|nr:DUF3159 domain-containing protein [Beutenbergiaceae bacterium]